MTERNYHVVDNTEDADYALLRFDAPYESRLGAFESSFHARSLEFNQSEQGLQSRICSTVPNIVDIDMVRPAVIPEITSQANAVLANFSSDSRAFLDIVFGISAPEGRLPYCLPGSMEVVEAQMEDVPFGTRHPVFKFGRGLEYANACSDSGRL